MATTVRVEDKLAATLRTLASEDRRPIGQVIEDAVAQYQKAKFWEGVHEDFARLRADPAAWADYENEIALFAGGSMDGLEDEPPYYTPAEEEEIRAEHARPGWVRSGMSISIRVLAGSRAASVPLSSFRTTLSISCPMVSTSWRPSPAPIATSAITSAWRRRRAG